MGSGTATITLDDALLTALANYALAKARIDLPGPLPTTPVPAPHVTVTTHSNGKIVVKATAMPPVEVEPCIGDDGLVDLKVGVGPMGLPGLINDAIQKPVNKQVEHMRDELAEQRLYLRLTRVETHDGALVVSAEIISSS